MGPAKNVEFDIQLNTPSTLKKIVVLSMNMFPKTSHIIRTLLKWHVRYILDGLYDLLCYVKDLQLKSEWLSLLFLFLLYKRVNLLHRRTSLYAYM